jgi:hypothetical protein
VYVLGSSNQHVPERGASNKGKSPVKRFPYKYNDDRCDSPTPHSDGTVPMSKFFENDNSFSNVSMANCDGSVPVRFCTQNANAVNCVNNASSVAMEPLSPYADSCICTILPALSHRTGSVRPRRIACRRTRTVGTDRQYSRRTERIGDITASDIERCAQRNRISRGNLRADRIYRVVAQTTRRQVRAT